MGRRPCCAQWLLAPVCPPLSWSGTIPAALRDKYSFLLRLRGNFQKSCQGLGAWCQAGCGGITSGGPFKSPLPNPPPRPESTRPRF